MAAMRASSGDARLPRRSGRLALVGTVAAVSALLLLYFGDLGGAGPADDAAAVEPLDVLFALAFVAYAGVGALIVPRHPGHPVGWLFLAQGLLGSVAELGGRFLTRGWRRVGILAAVVGVAWALAAGLEPGPLRSVETVENPLGVEPAGDVLAAVAGAGPLAFVVLVLAAGASLLVRYGRARSQERQQLKWLAVAVAVAIALLLGVVALTLAVDTDTGIWDDVTGGMIFLAVVGFPVATGLAILRRGLYEVDVVVNRALVYGALTATLGGAYLATVLLVGLALADTDVAVALATLAVAALFGPARARIQAAVDRRFYRRRYDAARTLDRFSGRLRDQVELDAVAADLRDVVRESLQPSTVSLWLRR